MKRQNEHIKIFDLPFVSGVEALSGQDIINTFRRHIHKTYIIGLVCKGCKIITCPDGDTKIRENEIFILNPGQVHACSSECQSSQSYKILSVSLHTMQSIASQISEKPEMQPYFKGLHYKSIFLSKMFNQLFEIIEVPTSEIQVESEIYSFLAHLLINYSESPPLIPSVGTQKDSIKRVCDYIEKNYSESLLLEKLAAIACLSPFHFQREFRKCIGITPHEYLSDIRIRASEKMLLKSEDIADIALTLGFFDQSHFSRAFRKTVGIPPGKYRKHNKN